eukprot:Hpha_TRINITY_DN10124_c0_g1::TRINITY_DN10124_c0_g1_i1::g.131685::m.131685
MIKSETVPLPAHFCVVSSTAHRFRAGPSRTAREVGRLRPRDVVEVIQFHREGEEVWGQTAGGWTLVSDTHARYLRADGPPPLARPVTSPTRRPQVEGTCALCRAAEQRADLLAKQVADLQCRLQEAEAGLRVAESRRVRDSDAARVRKAEGAQKRAELEAADARAALKMLEAAQRSSEEGAALRLQRAEEAKQDALKRLEESDRNRESRVGRAEDARRSAEAEASEAQRQLRAAERRAEAAERGADVCAERVRELEQAVEEASAARVEAQESATSALAAAEAEAQGAREEARRLAEALVVSEERAGERAAQAPGESGASAARAEELSRAEDALRQREKASLSDLERRVEELEQRERACAAREANVLFAERRVQDELHSRREAAEYRVELQEVAVGSSRRTSFVEAAAGPSRRASLQDTAAGPSRHTSFVESAAGPSRRASLQDIEARPSFAEAAAGPSRRASLQDMGVGPSRTSTQSSFPPTPADPSLEQLRERVEELEEECVALVTERDALRVQCTAVVGKPDVGMHDVSAGASTAASDDVPVVVRRWSEVSDSRVEVARLREALVSAERRAEEAEGRTGRRTSVASSRREHTDSDDPGTQGELDAALQEAQQLREALVKAGEAQGELEQLREEAQGELEQLREALARVEAEAGDQQPAPSDPRESGGMRVTLEGTVTNVCELTRAMAEEVELDPSAVQCLAVRGEHVWLRVVGTEDAPAAAQRVFDFCSEEGAAGLGVVVLDVAWEEPPRDHVVPALQTSNVVDAAKMGHQTAMYCVVSGKDIDKDMQAFARRLQQWYEEKPGDIVDELLANLRFAPGADPIRTLDALSRSLERRFRASECPLQTV